MKKHILPSSILTLITLAAVSFKSNGQTNWTITGNSNIDATTNFLGTTNNKAVLFKTNGTERMRIAGNGKFGIGTKKPETLLHVDGTTAVSLTTPGIFMLGDIQTNNIAMDVNVIQARFNGTASSIYLNYYGGATYLGPSGAASINTAGNLTTSYSVGIRGSYNAAYALNVNASASFSGINITDAFDNSAINFVKSGLNYGAYFSKTSTSSGVETIYSNNSGSGAGIASYSSSGIGVYGSSVSYHGVYGYTGGTQAAGDYAGYFSGAVFASAGYYSSDEKLKKKIKDVTSAMSLINKLKPKFYEFRNDGDYKLMGLPEGRHFGLLAQDVEKVLPELVRNSRFETRYAKTGPSTEADAKNSKTIMFKALNYNELIPILIKGMQEQQSLIDNQQSVMGKQQQQIDELKQMLQKILASNSSDAKAAEVASGAYLIQNAPNPFSENTTIKYYVPSSVKQAQLALYNMKGQLVKSYKLSAGMNSISITAGSIASGQYSYSLLADGKKVDAKSMVMTK